MSQTQTQESLIVNECQVCLSQRFFNIRNRNHFYPTRDFLFQFLHEDTICLKCGFVFSKTVPTDDFLSKFYGNSFYTETNSEVDYNIKNRIDFVSKFTNKSDSILEIGANNGAFVNSLKDAGFKAEGIDYLDSSSSQVEKGKKFDVILTYYMFEHLVNLDSFINSVVSILKENGKLLIEIPDFENYPAQSLNHEHFIHFSGPILEFYMNKKGFKLLELSREHKSREFGFVAMFAKTTDKITPKPLLQETVDKNLQAYFSAVKTAVQKMNDFYDVQEKVKKINAKSMIIWGMNDNATQLALLMKDMNITLIPVDKNPQKIGKIHPGFSMATISPDKIDTSHADSIYVAAVVFKQQILEQCKELFKNSMPAIV